MSQIGISNISTNNELSKKNDGAAKRKPFVSTVGARPTFRRPVLGDIGNKAGPNTALTADSKQNALKKAPTRSTSFRQEKLSELKKPEALPAKRQVPSKPVQRSSSINVSVSTRSRAVNDENNVPTSRPAPAVPAQLKPIAKAIRKPVNKPQRADNQEQNSAENATVKPKPNEERPIERKDSKNEDEENLEQTIGLNLARISKHSVKINTAKSFSGLRLSEVHNIDAYDAKEPQLVSCFINDIYNYLLELENKMPIRDNFLDGLEVSPRMRTLLIDWLVEVNLQFRLLQETLQLTIALVDRYLQLDGEFVTRKNFQLVGITALFIAIKYEEMFVPEISDLCFVTENAFSPSQIIKMEMRMLRFLNFGLGRPLPLHFLRRYSKAATSKPEDHTLAKYFIDLALLDYETCTIKPSMLAAAALFLALRILRGEQSDDKIWTPTCQYYSSYSAADIKPVVSIIAFLYIKYEPSQNPGDKANKYQSVRKKYAMSKFMRISLHPRLLAAKEVMVGYSRLARLIHNN